jgi:hypothetical protein
MAAREDLEQEACDLAVRLADELVESSERVDHRMGTFLLTALIAELGQRVQHRCWEQARRTNPSWDMAAAEAETLITAAWRCMETVGVLSNQFLPQHDVELPE